MYQKSDLPLSTPHTQLYSTQKHTISSYNTYFLHYAQKTTPKTQQNAQLNITKLLTSIYQITIIIYRKTIKLYQITINALYDVLRTLQG